MAAGRPNAMDWRIGFDPSNGKTDHLNVLGQRGARFPSDPNIDSRGPRSLFPSSRRSVFLFVLYLPFSSGIAILEVRVAASKAS